MRSNKTVSFRVDLEPSDFAAGVLASTGQPVITARELQRGVFGTDSNGTPQDSATRALFKSIKVTDIQDPATTQGGLDAGIPTDQDITSEPRDVFSRFGSGC